MKFKITTEGGSEIELEDGMEIDIEIGDQRYLISIEKHGDI